VGYQLRSTGHPPPILHKSIMGDHRVLVTGGAGFIGCHLVRALLEDESTDSVIVFDALTYAGNMVNLSMFEDHPKYKFIHGDICDVVQIQDAVSSHQFNRVYHLAAESHVDHSISGPTEFVETNVLGTFNLLETCRKLWTNMDGRFLHVSTDEVYGTLGETGFFDELTPFDPRSPYSASKAGSDLLARSYFHTYQFPVLITHCSNNFGPYQHPEKLVPKTVSRAIDEEAIPVYGDGSNVRDWIYVEDHVSALMMVMKQGRLGETYDVGGGNEESNIGLVNYICDEIDKFFNKRLGSSRKLIELVADRPGHDFRYAINTEKITRELGWQSKISFEVALNQTIQWYLDNQDWVKETQTKGE